MNLKQLINMLRVLVGNGDNMQAQICNLSREMETLKNQKEMHIIIEVKTSFERLMHLTAKERVNDIEETSIETSKTEMQKEKNKKNKTFNNCGIINSVTYM